MKKTAPVKKTGNKRISVKRLLKMKKSLSIISLYCVAIDNLKLSGAEQLMKRCNRDLRVVEFLLITNKNEFWVVL